MEYRDELFQLDSFILSSLLEGELERRKNGREDSN
jgi:hypothetical protein